MSRPNQRHTYTYWFEAYLLNDDLDEAAWHKILLALSRYNGLFTNWVIILKLENNTFHYYIGANKNVGILSHNLEGLTLKQISPDNINLPDYTAIEHFIQLGNNQNFLAIREKYQLKRNKQLLWAVFTLKTLTTAAHYCDMSFYFKDAVGKYSIARKRAINLPSHLLAIQLYANTKYLYKKPPKYLDIQKSMHIMKSDSAGALLEIDTFPYLPQSYYLPLASYDFARHSFIVGASGSGKSKMISLFIHRLLDTAGMKQNYRVVVIDPHASLEDELRGMQGAEIISFSDQDGSPALFANTNTDISAAVELTGALFRSLLLDQHNPKLERVLRCSLFVLMAAQVMSFDNLKRLITDIDYRNKLLTHVQNYVPPNVISFFGADFNELRTQSYNTAIAPLVSLIDEMQLQPFLTRQNEHGKSLTKLLGSNSLTVFSLSKIRMGEKVVKTVAGLLIQQIFLLAQARAFDEKILLIIDEVSIAQNPTIAQILAEARKYNLFIFLSQQYFGQIDKQLQAAIVANTSNYFVFRVSEEDARLLEGNLIMELPTTPSREVKRDSSKERETRIRMLSSLHNRQCIVRLTSEGQLLPAIKAKTMRYTPELYNAPQELKVYRQRTPVKFSEHNTTARKEMADHTPPLQQPMNLMEFLASQSSSRKKVNGKKK